MATCRDFSTARSVMPCKRLRKKDTQCTTITRNFTTDSAMARFAPPA
jgi:hypothetical protein